MSIRDTREARRLIQSMAPEGEFLAFINEREAQMLRDAGGSGIMTLAGIPSFVDFTDTSQGISAADTFSSAGGGGGLSGPSGDGGGSGFDDTADVNLGLTTPPTVTLGEDQEDDNARMMQALGIPPGVTFSGTDNFAAEPQRLPSIGQLAANLGLFVLGKNNPKVAAAIKTIEAMRGAKKVIDQFRNPDLGLNLSKMEERELKTLQTGKDVGLNTPAQNERLEELKEKKAAEEEQK